MHSALAVANFYLDVAKSKGVKLDPMKLQKLVVIAHGWHLAIHHEPLLDEDVQAYEYGPVVGSIFHAFKRFGAEPITELATDLDIRGRELFNPRVPFSDSRAMALLTKVWETHGTLSGIHLANLLHQPGSAWAEARSRNPRKKIVSMDDRDIEAEFALKVEANSPSTSKNSP